MLDRRPEVPRRAPLPVLTLLGPVLPGVLEHLLLARVGRGVELRGVLVVGAAAAPQEVVDRAGADRGDPQHDHTTSSRRAKIII